MKTVIKKAICFNRYLDDAVVLLIRINPHKYIVKIKVKNKEKIINTNKIVFNSFYMARKEFIKQVNLYMWNNENYME